MILEVVIPMVIVLQQYERLESNWKTDGSTHFRKTYSLLFFLCLPSYFTVIRFLSFIQEHSIPISKVWNRKQLIFKHAIFHSYFFLLFPTLNKSYLLNHFTWFLLCIYSIERIF
jgi:hypothetical protein